MEDVFDACFLIMFVLSSREWPIYLPPNYNIPCRVSPICVPLVCLEISIIIGFDVIFRRQIRRQ